MGFNMDEETLIIKGRKGDSASFTFNFNQDMTPYTFHFVVKKNISDETPIIHKQFAGTSVGAFTVDLTPEDTDKLQSKGTSYGVYYWGIKINIGTGFAQTIIPQDYKNPPMMYIYPEIGD